MTQPFKLEETLALDPEAQAKVVAEPVPREAILQRAEELIEAIRVRPQMYGGHWQGVEIAILDTLDARDFALAWPHEPPGDIGNRWCSACSRTHRESNGMLIDTLKYDGVTDDDAIRAKFVAALDEFLSCDGLYPFWSSRHGTRAEREVQAERWRAWYAVTKAAGDAPSNWLIRFRDAERRDAFLQAASANPRLQATDLSITDQPLVVSAWGADRAARATIRSLALGEDVTEDPS